MKKILIITLLMFGLTYANNSMAQQPLSVFMHYNNLPVCLALNEDGRFFYGYGHMSGAHNTGTWTQNKKGELILTFKKSGYTLQDALTCGNLREVVFSAKMINKNTLKCENMIFRKYPKHPTKRMRDTFGWFKNTIQYHRKKGSI